MELASESDSRVEANHIKDQSQGERKAWWQCRGGVRRWVVIGLICFLAVGVLGMRLKYLEQAFAETDKQKHDPLMVNNKSFLSRTNPFSPVPPPSPTPLPLSKQYIYAGSRLLAVKDAGVNVVAPSDLAVWRPSTGTWWVLGNQMTTQAWGFSADSPAPGDYDGDGKTDFCVYRPNEGVWYVMKSSDGSYQTTSFGTDEDEVAQADYDGDGKTDIALFRPSNKYWYIIRSSDSQTSIESLGGKGGDPVPADYDGDGKSDKAVWRNGSATFWVLRSTSGEIVSAAFGKSGDLPVIGDYDGDGRADLATWRDSDNKWRILQSSNDQTLTIEWGVKSTDKAVPADYDADGKCDIAIWRASGTYTGYWFILKSSNGQMRADLWGQAGDIPVPSRYRR
jgi:hypothetical protein